MTVKKLAGGPVYDYLIRQVAVQDAQVPAGGLTSYYSEKGEAPGTWIGAGLDGLGMSAGEIVTEAQMNHLFGTGEHPNADQLRAGGGRRGPVLGRGRGRGQVGGDLPETRAGPHRVRRGVGGPLQGVECGRGTPRPLPAA